MTMPIVKPRRRSRGLLAGVAVTLAVLAGGCASSGAYYSDVGVYGGFYYNDPWYWGGCCYRPPSGIGPPPARPVHPIERPPRPVHPIAPAPPRPMPRPAAAPRPARR